jgi:hypothetical protein
MSTQIRPDRRDLRVRGGRPAAQSPAAKRGASAVPAFGCLLGGAIDGVVRLATASRTGQVCAALVANMAAFSLWWMFCCVSALPPHTGIWMLCYLPALLLAHLVILLVLGTRLAEGAILAAGRGRVNLETLCVSLPRREPAVLQQPLLERTRG